MKRPRFVVYEAKDGFRWRLIAANGRQIAEGGEAYASRHGCERAVDRVRDATVQAVFVRHSDAETLVIGQPQEYPTLPTTNGKPH